MINKLFQEKYNFVIKEYSAFVKAALKHFIDFKFAETANK